ncbi:UvrD-helicase domain-containing protein [Tardiphaga sp. P5_C7]
MNLLKPEKWRPLGIDDLEPAAWASLHHEGSSYVVAGPGAGKTEFLAQKAAYLLQTGICRSPARILAISFKTDAAENLAKRVRERCSPELAARFSSLTFDAFTKGLVDRFWGAIPEFWQPTREYDILFAKYKDYSDFLTRARLGAPKELQSKVAAVNVNAFESRDVGTYRLPTGPIEGNELQAYLVRKWFEETLGKKPKSLLSFIQLNRLAELIVRSRSEIRDALRYTYPFVFVDEFQDTTFAQYDFLKSVFGDGNTVVTAVGDEKQRIMAWAGARNDAFKQFSEDFKAKRFELLFNFRSSPGLVQIQHIVARALDASATETQSKADALVSDDVAKIWKCSTETSEATHLADWISKDIASRGLNRRDYAILVRQTAEKFEQKLAPAFAAKGLRLRNEAKIVGRMSLQDLLTDPVNQVAIAIVRLASVRKSPEAWAIAAAAIPRIRNIDPEDDVKLQKIEAELLSFIQSLRLQLANATPSIETAKLVSAKTLEFLNLEDVKRTFVEYHSGEALEIATEALALHLGASADSAENWIDCVDAFEGIGQVPLMTVHKSKGLEYDTVVFVGLDDSSWWSYTPDNPEGLATFFVALSRAKQRAIFTFCGARGDRTKIADLYSLLTKAGVQEEAAS